MAVASKRIDIVAFEKWIESIPDQFDVRLWKHGGLDIWPLYKTTLIGLGIRSMIEEPKFGLRTGGGGWQASVLLDYFVLSGCRKAFPPRLPRGQTLADSVVYFASGGHGRDLGDLFLTPSLDVPAALLERAGHRAVFWYENFAEGDPNLSRTLHAASFGLADLLADARARAMRFGTRGALAKLPGFAACLEFAARHLGLRKWFLLLWLARQVNFAIAVTTSFQRMFDKFGRPKCLVMLNSGSWSTAGLVAAAKHRGIPVIEVHHGAESRGAITAPGQRPHFSLFNTAPDALISWECRSRGDDLVLSAGPLGLQLPAIIPDGESDNQQRYARLRQLIEQQRDALAQRFKAGRYAGEVLVSLQPGDDGRWIFDVVQELTIEVFLWVRLHTLGAKRTPLAPSAEIAARVDWELGSSTLLSLLLERADVHLTRFSGVTLEAAAMGLPTVATEEYAADLYGRDVEAPALRIATSPRAIASHIETMIIDRSLKRVRTLPDLSGVVPFIERIANIERPSRTAQSEPRGNS